MSRHLRIQARAPASGSLRCVSALRHQLYPHSSPAVSRFCGTHQARTDDSSAVDLLTRRNSTGSSGRIRSLVAHAFEPEVGSVGLPTEPEVSTHLPQKEQQEDELGSSSLGMASDGPSAHAGSDTKSKATVAEVAGAEATTDRRSPGREKMERGHAGRKSLAEASLDTPAGTEAGVHALPESVRDTSALRHAKSQPIIKVGGQQNIGSGASFLKRALRREEAALVVCSGPESTWQALRVVRCARSMLIEEEGTVPVFQPVLMREARHGLSPGTLVLYHRKILHGHFSVKFVMRVSNSSRAQAVATAIVGRIKEGKSCALECFGKVPSLVSLEAIELARRRLLLERLDIAVALDPVVVEVDRPDIGATLMNRFILLECAARDPTKLRVKVNIRLKSDDT